MRTIDLCMIAPEFLPVWGGTGSYVIELLKNLPEEVSVHLVTLKRKIHESSENRMTNNDPEHVLNRDMDIHYISNAKETFFYNLGFQVECLRKIPELHKKYEFDVIHSQFGHMSDILLQVFRKIRVPNVTTVHGTIALLEDVLSQSVADFRDLEWSEKQVRLFHPALRVLELLYAKHVSRFVAVSKAARNRILSDLRVDPDKVCTIYNGVDHEFFCTPRKKEIEKKYSKPTVVYIGRIMAKKGIPFLINAMPKILNERPDTRFLFVGGGKLFYYRQMVQKLGIPRKNFSFIGHVGYFERPKILQKATVFVNPSLFELCSLSILEAMSCGVSVVAGNVGGNPEIIESGHNGILLPRLDSQELATSVISLLQNESLNKEIGREARKTIERSFTSKKCAQETYEVYRKIIH